MVIGSMASSRLVSIRVVGRQSVAAAPAVRSEEVSSGPAAIRYHPFSTAHGTRGRGPTPRAFYWRRLNNLST